MMVDAVMTIASGMDHLADGDVAAAQADYDLVRETYPFESEWMMDPELRHDLHILRDGLRNQRKLLAKA